MGLLENQYFVTAACFLLIPVAVYVAAWFPAYAWAGLLIVAGASLLTRFIVNRPIKTLCYLTLGFASFWIAGTELYAPLGEEWRMLSFLPFMMLAGANATAALVAYNDGEVNGTIFAAASLIAILVTRGPLDTGSVDRFLLTGLLFAAAGVVVVKFASWARGSWYAVYNALKAGVCAGAIYGIIYTLRVFDVNVLNMSDLQGTVTAVSPVLVNAWWASAITTFFVVSLALMFYELVLYLLDLQRVVSKDYIALVKGGKETAVERLDPYVGLISKLEDFYGKFSTYDVDMASQLLGQMEREYYALSAKGLKSPVKGNSGRLLMEARSMLLGTQLEATPRAPVSAMKEEPKKAAIDVPDGTVVLVEGPIGSRKETYCLDLVKKRMEKGEKAMVVSFEPEKEGGYLGEDENLSLVRVEQNINDMALSISRALEESPKIVFFNVLYWLSPNYSVTTLSGFLASTVKKLKNAKATGIFVVEQEMLAPQVLSTLESVFDGVIEFAAVEEGGRTRSRYRVKEFKFKKFDAEWRDYG